MTRKPRTPNHNRPAALVVSVVPAGGADPIRWSRVRNARERIAVGFYDRDEVQDDLVEAVLRELNRR